jgi:N-acetylneuraminic acid mutarotase
MAIGSVLVAGGAQAPAGGGSLTSAETFSPQNGTWTTVGSMANPRAYHTATEFSAPTTKVLVAGGAGPHGEYLTSAEIYDEGAKTWSTTGAMSTGRGYHAAVALLNGKILVMGGLTGNNGLPTATAEIWDPATGQWTPTGSMSTARVGHTATMTLGGQVLVAGL